MNVITYNTIHHHHSIIIIDCAWQVYGTDGDRINNTLTDPVHSTSWLFNTHKDDDDGISMYIDAP